MKSQQKCPSNLKTLTYLTTQPTKSEPELNIQNPAHIHLTLNIKNYFLLVVPVVLVVQLYQLYPVVQLSVVLVVQLYQLY